MALKNHDNKLRQLYEQARRRREFKYVIAVRGAEYIVRWLLVQKLGNEALTP